MSYFPRIDFWCIVFLIVAEIKYSWNQEHNINSEYYSDNDDKICNLNPQIDSKSYGSELFDNNDKHLLNKGRNVRDISDYVDDQSNKDSPNINDAELHLFSWWKGMSESNKNKKNESSTGKSQPSESVFHTTSQAVGSAPPSLKGVANSATPPVNRQMADNSTATPSTGGTTTTNQSAMSVDPSKVSGTPTNIEATKEPLTYLTTCYTITDTCAPIITLVAAPICSQENAAISAASNGAPFPSNVPSTPSISPKETSTAKNAVTGAVRDATFVVTLVFNKPVSPQPLGVNDKESQNISQPLSSGVLLPVYNISQVTYLQESTMNKPTEAANNEESDIPGQNNESIQTDNEEIVDKQIGQTVIPQIIGTTQVLINAITQETDTFLIQKLTSNNKSDINLYRNINEKQLSNSGIINEHNLSSNIDQELSSKNLEKNEQSVTLEKVHPMAIYNNGIIGTTDTILNNDLLLQTEMNFIEKTSRHENINSLNIGNLEENVNPCKANGTSDIQDQDLLKKSDNLTMSLHLENSSPLPTMSQDMLEKNNIPNNVSSFTKVKNYTNKGFDNLLAQTNIHNLEDSMDSKGTNKAQNKVLQLPENITFSFLIEDLFPFTLSFMNSSPMQPPVVQKETILDHSLNPEQLATQNNFMHTDSPLQNYTDFEKPSLEKTNKSLPVIEFPTQAESIHSSNHNSNSKMNISSKGEMSSENINTFPTTKHKNEFENNLSVKTNNSLLNSENSSSTKIFSIGETGSNINSSFETLAKPELYHNEQEKHSGNKNMTEENVYKLNTEQQILENIASSVGYSLIHSTNSPTITTENNNLEQTINYSKEDSRPETLDQGQNINFTRNSNLFDDKDGLQVKKLVNLSESSNEQSNLHNKLINENTINEQDNYVKNNAIKNNSNLSSIQELFQSQHEYEIKIRLPRESSKQLQSVNITPGESNINTVIAIDKKNPTKTYFKFSNNFLAQHSKSGQNLVEICKNVTCQGDNILAPCCGSICPPGMCKGEDLSYLLPIPGLSTTTTVKQGNAPNKQSHFSDDSSLFVRVPRDSTLDDLVKFQLMHGISAPDSKELMNALKEVNYQVQKVNKEFHPELTLYPPNVENQSFPNNFGIVDTNRILENLKSTLADSMINTQLGTNTGEKDKYRIIRNQSQNDQDESVQESNSVLVALRRKAEEEARHILELQLQRKQEEETFYKERENNLKELKAIQEMKQRESETSKLCEVPNIGMFQTDNLGDNPYTKLVQQIGKSDIGNDEVFDRYSEMHSNISNYALPQTNPVDISLSDKLFPELKISKNVKGISFPILKLDDENSNYIRNERNKRTVPTMNGKNIQETFDSFHNDLLDLQKYIASNKNREKSKADIDKSNSNLMNINIPSIMEKIQSKNLDKSEVKFHFKP